MEPAPSVCQVCHTDTPRTDAPARAEPAKRAVQFVTTLAQRRRMAEWMVQEATRCASDKHIASKAVRHFPALFPGNAKANLMRASRIWKQRGQLIAADPRQLPSAPHDAALPAVATRIEKQALPGRGRKRATWSDALQRDLLQEFHRMRSAGLAFTPKLVRAAAHALLRDSAGGEYARNMADPRSAKPLPDCLTSRWVRAFTDRYQLPIASRAAAATVPEARRLQVEMNERMIAYHLGELSRLFTAGELREEDVETVSPIHFVLNTTNGKTLGFGEQEPPNYAELINGSRAMTLLVRISGGCGATVEPPFLILQGRDYTYPLEDEPDDIPDVSYRTSPSGWMDQVVLTEFLKEKRAIKPLPKGRKRIMYVEPATWHACASQLGEPLGAINTEPRFFPRNCADSIQPVETVVRHKIKEAWIRGWEQMKARMRDIGVWAADGKDSNGGHFAAAPRYFLKLAATAISDVNNLRDEKGMSYARKAMVENGMALNVNGCWELEQLHPELQAIVAKHRQHFDGKLVTAEPKPEPSQPQLSQPPAARSEGTQPRASESQAAEQKTPNSSAQTAPAPQQPA